MYNALIAEREDEESLLTQFFFPCPLLKDSLATQSSCR